MKKKYRDITVNGVKYAWMVKMDSLIVWKDKKPFCTYDVTHCTVTPQIVADIIRENNG